MNPVSKKLTTLLFLVAAVCIIAGVVLFALMVPGAASVFFRVCFILMAVMLLLIGVAIFYLLYNSRDTEPNFFLYDTATYRNSDIEELTFERVNSRMGYFLSTLTQSPDRLWMDNVLTVNPARFGVKEIYRPLAAYKMLYDLAELDMPEKWSLFFQASNATFEALLGALHIAGEDDMLTRLRGARERATDTEDIEWVRDYIIGNKTYISRRMMGYVRKNIEWFY